MWAAQASDGAPEVAQFKDRIQNLRQRVTELADDSNLLDTLYFAWSDRSYARATLAILVKVAATLDREADCRANGNGKIDDATVESMFQWADEAVERVVRAEPSEDFRPHRLKVTWADILDGRRAPPLFAFVDRTNLPPRDPALGDLDLLAAFGQRAYICGDPSNSATARFDERARRAEALGMTVVDTVPAGTPGRCGSCLLNNAPRWPERLQRVVCMEFRNLLRGGELRESSGFTEVPAILDNPNGEALAASLARRALLRGVMETPTYAAYRWTPPIVEVEPQHQYAALAATLWVQALEGQQLTLVDGWRDHHNENRSETASVFLSPTRAETIAHTALDLQRLARFVTAFEGHALLALIVGDEAVYDKQSNEDGESQVDTWASWVQPIWEVLVARQIRFDVVSDRTEEKTLRGRYQIVFPLHKKDCANPAETIGKIERRLAQLEDHVYRLTAREMDGMIAADMYVRAGKTPVGKACAAVVNLTDRPRALKLRGRPEIGPSHDVIADQPIPEPSQRIEFAPWQVRLLWPVE